MRKTSPIIAILISVFLLSNSNFAQKHQTLDEQVAFAFDQNFPDWKSGNAKTFDANYNFGHGHIIGTVWNYGNKKISASIKLFATNADAKESYKMFFARSIMPKMSKVPELGDTAFLVETASRTELDFVKENIRISLTYDFPIADKYKNHPSYYFPSPPKEVEFIKKVGKVIADSFIGEKKVTACYNDFYRTAYPAEFMDKDKFFASIYRTETDSIKNFINTEIDLNVRDRNGKSALHLAIHQGCFDTVKLLVDSGIDLNAKDKNGLTPLMYAARFGDLDVLKLLISKGADLQAKDKNGRNVLFQTLSTPNFGITNWRLTPNYQRELRTQLIDKIPVFRELKNEGMDFNVQDSNGYSLLHAYISGLYTFNEEIPRILLDYGVDINAKSNSKTTALITLASSNTNEKLKLSLIKLFISKGAEINVKNRNNQSAISYLRRKEQANIRDKTSEEKMQPIREMIRVLIEAGAKE